jgi:hypothetical protein
MKTSFFKTFCLSLALTLVAASAAVADVKIKTRSTTEGQGGESTVYIKGQRERTESGPDSAHITQCDRKRAISLNNRDKTYTVTSLVPEVAGATATPNARPAAKPAPSERGGLVTYSTVTTDLNETKKFPQFNLVARHYRSEMTVTSSDDACNPINMKIVRDGWYAEVNAEFSCDLGWRAGSMPQMPAMGGCRDRMEMKNTGPSIKGYPVQETMTMTFSMNVNGQPFSRTTTTTTEIVELSNATLDAALFEIPAGYKEVKDADARTGDAGDADDDADAGRGMKLGTGAQPASSAATPSQGEAPAETGGAAVVAGVAASTSPGPKREGVVRVGVVMPYATTADHMNAAALAEGVRNSLVETLPAPSFEAVPLEAQVPEQIVEEARRKECDYILYTNITHKKGGGGLGGFLRKAAPVADIVPMGSGTSAVVASTVTRTAIHTAAAVATSIKSKDEVAFDYRLVPVSSPSTIVVSKTIKAKAKSDGEDVLTPLIGQEASAVQSAVARQ